MSLRSRTLLRVLTLAACVAIIVSWRYSYRLWHATGPYLSNRVDNVARGRYVEWYGLEAVNGSIGVFRAVVFQSSEWHGGNEPDVVGRPMDQPVPTASAGWAWEGDDDVDASDRAFGKWGSSRGRKSIAGFALISRSFASWGGIYSIHGLAIPHWLAAILSLIPAILWLRRRLIASYRRKRGRCLACGYDLRGITGGACPECGASATGAAITPPVER